MNLPEDVQNPEVTLEVSDGASTKTTTVSLRKDVINANRVKESKDSVIVFSYPALSEDTLTVESATDAVYLYLGENIGVAKYSIDSDIKEDSDLNGDPADDTDNKGTDSYVTGAPFVLKNFDAKRERTVRITLFDASGKKLASRDITIVLSYVDANAPATMTGTTVAPKNLSDADKAGLETLKDLINSKAPEGQRVHLMQLLSQLQENWSDDREKTKTIIDFQSAISELAMPDADKTELLTILDSFLLSDSEVKDDMALATSVLRKLIPSTNPKYEEIFGADGKSGLVGEILSHPTNLDLNKQIGEKILSYIKDDTGITDNDKLILKEQLRVIIYGGSKNVVAATTETPPASTGSGLG